MKKRALSLLLAALLILSCSGLGAMGAELEEDARGKNLSGMDLRTRGEQIYELQYDAKTKWPAAGNLPEGFDPAALMEWSKDPGLGVRWLHAMGYTGAGVNVAYIDQPLGKVEHPELKGIDLHYSTQTLTSYGQKDNRAYHGCAVLSMLSGESVGTAPGASVYYVAEPSWLADQTTRADAIYELIELNRQLPEDEKIKVVGISNNLRDDIPNREALETAVAEAEREGIFVMFCGEFSTAVAQPMSDRDDPESYSPLNWSGRGTSPYENGQLYVPVDRTFADWQSAGAGDYIREYYGGASWTAPFVTGLMAIGLQIDPTLTGQEMLALMKATAYRPSGVTRGGLIDPVAFARRVAEDAGKTLAPLGDYELCLYNSDRVTQADLAAIRAYANGVAGGGERAAILLDVRGKKTAQAVYEAIGTYRDGHPGNLAGVQIFGTAADVPAFQLNFEVEMYGGEVDRAGTFLSDYFYGNQKNQVKYLEEFSICRAFREDLPIAWLQDWPVGRLPLTRGDYAAYFEKVADYNAQLDGAARPRLVNFDGPIFVQENHTDDMGWFLQNRMDREFKILSPEDYTVYGNQQGLYPANARSAGDFTAEDLAVENAKGIMDLLINTHGQWNNLDQAIFVRHEDAARYQDAAREIRRGDNGVDEVRLSLVNTETIDDVLGENYYNLMVWACENATDMGTENLTYAALKGKAVDVFAATHIISNNGVDNKASLTKMRENNFYYFYYSFLKNYYGGMSRGESFWRADRDYVAACLAHPSIPKGDGNFQFNLHNALSYHFFGLLSGGPVGRGGSGAPETVVLPVLGRFRDGSTMLPMRALLEALGFRVDWDGGTLTVTATRGNEVLIHVVGSGSYTLNGSEQALPVPSFAEDGVTYLPVRAISEAAGSPVDWDNETKTATILAEDGTLYVVKTVLTPGKNT